MRALPPVDGRREESATHTLKDWLPIGTGSVPLNQIRAALYSGASGKVFEGCGFATVRSQRRGRALAIGCGDDAMQVRRGREHRRRTTQHHALSQRIYRSVRPGAASLMRAG